MLAKPSPFFVLDTRPASPPDLAAKIANLHGYRAVVRWWQNTADQRGLEVITTGLCDGCYRDALRLFRSDGILLHIRLADIIDIAPSRATTAMLSIGPANDTNPEPPAAA